MIASPPNATGSMWTRKAPNVARLQIPTSMLCGFPVTESTEPTFAPVASPIKYACGRRVVEVHERQALNGDEQVREGEDDETGGHVNAEVGTRNAEQK